MKERHERVMFWPKSLEEAYGFHELQKELRRDLEDALVEELWLPLRIEGVELSTELDWMGGAILA